MISTLVAASWLTTSSLCSLALGRFRFSVIAKYTAPLHCISLCFAALVLSWQSITALLTVNLAIAFVASHTFGEFKEDSSADLPDLKNQLEALEQGPPYNFLWGRFYPKESIAPLAAFAHAIDLFWRYLNQRPIPDVEEEVRRLKERAEATYRRLAAHRMTDEGLAPEEKELLYWAVHISPIDPAYALNINRHLLHVRIRLKEPLPTDDLRRLGEEDLKKGDLTTSLSKSPAFPEIRAWVTVYNREPALHIEHLRDAFSSLWDESRAHKILFILMRDYGLCPDKRPKTYVPGLESIYDASDKASHSLAKLTSGACGPMPGWRVKESEGGLAYEIQSEYILPQELLERRRAPTSATQESSATYASPIQDRLNWLEILRQFRKFHVLPKINWDRDFVVISATPDLCNPFFKSDRIEGPNDDLTRRKWRDKMIQSLLKGLNPFDGHGTTLWRLFLLHYFSKKNTPQSKAFEGLCEDSTCWYFAYKEYEEGPYLQPGMAECYPIYRGWRARVRELVRAVQRTHSTHKLTDNGALEGIAKAFKMEWEDRSSPLRALSFIEEWPLAWWLEVMDRSMAKAKEKFTDCRGQKELDD